MKRILVDTNILVSFLTDRNEAQQEAAARLFAGGVAREHEIVLHLVAATEMAYVLQNLYGQSAEEVSGILRDLLASPGVVPRCEMDWSQLVDLWPEKLPELGDAALAAALQAGCADELATFDAKLARRLKRQGIPVHA